MDAEIETTVQATLSKYLPVFAHAVIRGAVIFVAALGVVYIVGRMLGLVERPQTKNAIALVVMVSLSYWSVQIYDMQILVHPYEAYWRAIIYTAIAAIFYVLAGFDLYDRFNAWCDVKFGKTRSKKR